MQNLAPGLQADEDHLQIDAVAGRLDQHHAWRHRIILRIVEHDEARNRRGIEPQVRTMWRVHHAIAERPCDHGLGRKRGEIRRAQDAGHVVGVVMGEHDQAGIVERALQLRKFLREIRLRAAERFMGLTVEAGIDHHRAVRVHHLERRARHRDRRFVAPADDEFARPDAGGDAHAVDRYRQGSRQQAREPADRGQIGRERLFVRAVVIVRAAASFTIRSSDYVAMGAGSPRAERPMPTVSKHGAPNRSSNHCRDPIANFGCKRARID